jgi:hypothetical protein
MKPKYQRKAILQHKELTEGQYAQKREKHIKVKLREQTDKEAEQEIKDYDKDL